MIWRRFVKPQASCMLPCPKGSGFVGTVRYPPEKIRPEIILTNRVIRYKVTYQKLMKSVENCRRYSNLKLKKRSCAEEDTEAAATKAAAIKAC